jgi:hypothetical protein
MAFGKALANIRSVGAFLLGNEPGISVIRRRGLWTDPRQAGTPDMGIFSMSEERNDRRRLRKSASRSG